MNDHTPYELIITQKLQQLPVPDMADAIWARIERQLDIDMPTDDGGNAPTTPRGGGWIGGAALGIFVGAFLLVFFLFRNETKRRPQEPVENTPALQWPVESGREETGGGEKSTNVLPKQRRVEPPPVISDSARVNKPDSVIVVPPLKPGDSLLAPALPPSTQRTMQDSIKPKRRGVSGISDSDYRIVPSGKDSL